MDVSAPLEGAGVRESGSRTRGGGGQLLRNRDRSKRRAGRSLFIARFIPPKLLGT